MSAGSSLTPFPVAAEVAEAVHDRIEGALDATTTLVGFARTLRAAGVAATQPQLLALIAALDALDPRRRANVYWAGRLTLCADHEELLRYDRAFDAYFGAAPVPRPSPVPAVPLRRPTVSAASSADDADQPDQVDPTSPTVATAASRAEVLRHRDVAELSAADLAELHRILAAFPVAGEPRPSRRWRPAHNGPIDAAGTMRELLRRGGEPARLRRRTHPKRPRRVVLLLDVSGSMSPYAEALLRFAHAAARRGRGRTEVFTIGTRLTRVSPCLMLRDPGAALAAVSAAVPDWSGGTRLGELVKEFLDRWGQRSLARGAVVVVLSDGWECGDPALLAEQTARLRRLAHRLVWVNPLKARPGYAPLAAGMAAALPHVDDFVEGHSLAALERLAAVVAGQRSHG